MKRKRTKNYLDFVPAINPVNTWDMDDKGDAVTVHMVNRGLYHWIAQKLFRSPRISHINLDEYGSFLWLRIDGARSVGDLADELRAQFGEAAEPIYDRLVHYIKVLYNNRLIVFCRTGTEK